MSALNAWELAVEEISSDFARTVAITNAVAKFSDPVVIDAILMHISSVEQRYALKSLEGLIVGERGKAAAERAKSMFEHISGEPYSSKERTELILKGEAQ